MSAFAIMVLVSLHNTSGSLPSMGLWITTLTDPKFKIPSIPEGISFPVPIRVIGTTGTLVFAAILKAPFYISIAREINIINILPLSSTAHYPHLFSSLSFLCLGKEGDGGEKKKEKKWPEKLVPVLIVKKSFQTIMLERSQIVYQMMLHFIGLSFSLTCPRIGYINFSSNNILTHHFATSLAIEFVACSTNASQNSYNSHRSW